jgi:hypothetical protein
MGDDDLWGSFARVHGLDDPSQALYPVAFSLIRSIALKKRGVAPLFLLCRPSDCEILFRPW